MGQRSGKFILFPGINLVMRRMQQSKIYTTFTKTPLSRGTAAIPRLCLSHEKVTTHSTLLSGDLLFVLILNLI